VFAPEGPDRLRVAAVQVHGGGKPQGAGEEGWDVVGPREGETLDGVTPRPLRDHARDTRHRSRIDPGYDPASTDANIAHRMLRRHRCDQCYRHAVRRRTRPCQARSPRLASVHERESIEDVTRYLDK
jgi:hypothetical protein